MIFRQITHNDLGCASYLIGDEKAGVAAVVDPRFETSVYLMLARYIGVRIEHILETHTHADHVSGHGRLAVATGATIHIHRAAEPEYDHEPFDDGWELQLGALRVRAVHTPGHRPEHTSFVLTDTTRSSEPWAVLAGDTLFVGDVARPDLAIEKAEGARGIFHALHDKLLGLPDYCELWPAHLGGSMCGGPGMDLKIASTIGFERANNPMLQIADEDEFVRRSLARIGDQPPNFQAIVELNRGPLLTDGVGLLPLAPRQIELKRATGALIVDTRTEVQFDDAHIPGSVCIPITRAGFGSRLAWIADRDQEVVLIGRDDDDSQRAGIPAIAVGIRKLAGFAHGGLTSWRLERRPVDRIQRETVEELHAHLGSDAGVQILDVRDANEWEAGHIPGSQLKCWHDITELPAGLDPERPIAVICASGQRAATAGSLLQRYGAHEVIHVVDGGVPTWAALGYPIEPSPARTAAALA
jgi:glyoxylase-like metal-dependent hydrolase (beta-lactamase superfamily II)/rhodanese-related sulfurtransferase